MPPASRPLRTTLRALLGVALLIGAIWLVTRPLTALLIFGHAAAALAGIPALLHVPQTISALPYVASVALALGGCALVVCAVRPGATSRRVAAGLWALAAAGLAVLAWPWPDAALVLLAVAGSLAMGVAGVVLVVRAVRGRPEPRRRRHGWPLAVGGLVAVFAVAAAGVGSAQLLGTVPRAGAFYTWSEPVPEEPGTLLRTEPYEGEAPSGASAYRILYSTTYSDGSPALASAVVAVPNTPSAEPRLMLAWQHGTTGVSQPCAPSLTADALTDEAIPGASHAIERGWVVVATDYPGQGTAGRYPYLIGQGQSRATLDGVRAVQQLQGADASTRTLLWGHSQGGHATLWAGQIAADYAPELDVVGVAALSSASDPLALARRVLAAGSGPLADIVTSLVLVPYADEYPDITFDDTVHPAGHTFVESFASRCPNQAVTLVSALTAVSLGADAPLYEIDLASGPVHDRLRDNIADAVMTAPLFLGQGTEDESVPIQIQRDLSASLCAAGRTVVTHEYAGRTHMGVVAAGSPLLPDLFTWTDEVLAGQSPSNCQ